MTPSRAYNVANRRCSPRPIFQPFLEYATLFSLRLSPHRLRHLITLRRSAALETCTTHLTDQIRLIAWTSSLIGRATEIRSRAESENIFRPKQQGFGRAVLFELGHFADQDNVISSLGFLDNIGQEKGRNDIVRPKPSQSGDFIRQSRQGHGAAKIRFRRRIKGPDDGGNTFLCASATARRTRG